MSKYYWIFGGAAGLFSVVMEYLLFSGRLGFDKSSGVIFSKLGALLICIIFGTILIKKMSGTISFIRTTIGGVTMALICSTVAITGYTAMHYPDGSFFNEAKIYSLEKWEEHTLKTQAEEAQEVSEEEFQKMKDARSTEIDREFGLQMYVGFTLVGYLLFSLLVSAFTAAFVADRQSLGG